MIIDSENASNDGTLDMDDRDSDFFTMLLQKDLQLINGLFQLYPDQESLFQHRKYLLYSLMKVLSQNGNQNSVDLLFRDEVSFIEQQFSRSIRIQVSNEWHLILMKRHTHFLNRVLGWELGSWDLHLLYDIYKYGKSPSPVKRVLDIVPCQNIYL